MSRIPFSLTPLCKPADQSIHYPTTSTPPASYRKHSYTSEIIGNSLSLPDKLELLDHVRNRRFSTGSLTPQMTPFGSPLGTPSGGSPQGSPSASPRNGTRKNSLTPQIKSLTRQGSLSSLTCIEEERIDESIDGFMKEAIGGDINTVLLDTRLDRQVSVDINTCMNMEHAERRRRSSTSMMVVSSAVLDMERKERTFMVTEVESLIRTNAADPIVDSLKSSTMNVKRLSQDSLPSTTTATTETVATKPRKSSLTKTLEESAMLLKKLTTSQSQDNPPSATANDKPRKSSLTKCLDERALLLSRVTILDNKPSHSTATNDKPVEGNGDSTMKAVIISSHSPQRLSLDSQIAAAGVVRDKPRLARKSSIDSSPLFSRMPSPPVVPVHALSSHTVGSDSPTSPHIAPSPSSQSNAPSSPPSVTVELTELNTKDSYRTNSEKFKKNNHTTTASSNSNSSHPSKDTPSLSHHSHRRSSNPLMSLFRTFPSWSSAVDSTANTTTTTTTTISSMSLWSRLRSPSQPTITNRENDNLRRLKEEVKQDKTTRLQSSVSSPSLAMGGASSLDLAELMNTGQGIASLRQAPVNQRVYVVEE